MVIRGIGRWRKLSRRPLPVEGGRLTSYLYDHLTAEREGVESTGNGRRESFRHLPIPRMTNTYIAPGEATPDEMIAEVERGFYAVSFGSGQVDPATGDFVFGVSEGYLAAGEGDGVEAFSNLADHLLGLALPRRDVGVRHSRDRQVPEALAAAVAGRADSVAARPQPIVEV